MQKGQKTSIGFASDLVPLVLDGSKTLTYRLGEKYDFLQVGDQIDARDSSTGHIFAKLKIVEKLQITFKDLPLERKGHSAYKSKEEQKEAFQKYYSNIQDSDKVIILRFRVVVKTLHK